MRALLIFLTTCGLFAAAHAADPVTGRILKVLPLLLDTHGRDATSPSLFDRDAYQAQLKLNANEVSAIRYDVLWKASRILGEKVTLRAELRTVGARGIPQFKTLETEATPGSFRRWTSLTLGGEDFQKSGNVVAWRVTLWCGEKLLDEQKSFLW